MNATTQWSQYQTRVRAVIEYIHENPGVALNSDALAEVAHLSPYHWHRIYKAITGESAAATVKRTRMHHAAAALLRSDKPVVEIGASVGFPDVHSFTRTFKAYYGVAPGQFRDAHPAVVDEEQHDDVHSLEHQSVRMVEVPERQLVGSMHYGDFMTIGATFEKVMAECSIHGLISAEPQTLGVYFCDPECIEERDLSSFAGVVIAADGKITVPDGLDKYTTKSGKYAVLTHKGPYALLSHSYQYLYSSWLPASNEVVRDEPCCEIYLNSPIDTPPQELLTEICLPIE